jgi:hypothetical protein
MRYEDAKDGMEMSELPDLPEDVKWAIHSDVSGSMKRQPLCPCKLVDGKGYCTENEFDGRPCTQVCTKYIPHSSEALSDLYCNIYAEAVNTRSDLEMMRYRVTSYCMPKQISDVICATLGTPGETLIQFDGVPVFFIEIGEPKIRPIVEKRRISKEDLAEASGRGCVTINGLMFFTIIIGILIGGVAFLRRRDMQREIDGLRKRVKKLEVTTKRTSVQWKSKWPKDWPEATWERGFGADGRMYYRIHIPR